MLFFLLISSGAFAQTFYVEPTEKGFEKKIIEKLKYDSYKVTADSSAYDYKIECLIRQTSKFNSMYKGYIRISDKTGKEVARSEEVRKGAVAVNGFNAADNIFGVIAEKQLPQIIKTLSK
ncbi:hypothetical protein DYBT9623_04407 [Dyadobacter sp. CECT 9623]|uniref:DUF4468 domain-containing protein n=1 Tax=Dyadobacter linearis TaxID=2823330 RepID=A0ABM8UVP3_9BACT|nr:hypothetical protein DYBT9623_04407 [Dyadobacter sp. CECT 9623]